MQSPSTKYYRTVKTFAAILVITAGCVGKRQAPQVIEFSGPTMGTMFSIKVVTKPSDREQIDIQALDLEIHAELEKINMLMSTWDLNSELSRFNRSTSLEPFPVSPITFEVFEWAVKLEQETNGALDVTSAPLLELWGLGPYEHRDHIPDSEAVTRTLDAIGINNLALDSTATTVQKARPDIQCEFSALAPGYTADRLATLLESHGFDNFLVDIGGEFRARGQNAASVPWQIAIELPDESGEIISRIVPVSNSAIATSGDYRNYYEVNGQRITHILDPRTGWPIKHRLASVTVLDTLAVRADGLSTAFMVLGLEKSLEQAKELDLAALFIIRNNDGGFTEYATSRFDAMMQP
jgi:thiamine biosynthesis lipoprotein